MKKIKILQLCCFTNLWDDRFEVESWDLRLGSNIFNCPDDRGSYFDFILAAPPCDQYTKANYHNWLLSPGHFNNITKKCLEIIDLSRGVPFVLENPPGRIEQFFPALRSFRVITFRVPNSNKEYVLYSNILLCAAARKRYGFKSEYNKTKKGRETYSKEFINFLTDHLINLYGVNPPVK
jgi:site-specific DNA-cytosine methylase